MRLLAIAKKRNGGDSEWGDRRSGSKPKRDKMKDA